MSRATIDYIETQICNCGTASETAEIAALLLNQIGYLRASGARDTALDRLERAYSLLRMEICERAGISREHGEDEIDEAIKGCLPEISNTQPAPPAPT